MKFRVLITRKQPGERAEQYFGPTQEAAERVAKSLLKPGDSADIFETVEVHRTRISSDAPVAQSRSINPKT